MTVPRLRVAIAGAGMISRHHLLAWSKLSDQVEIVAICDPDTMRASDRAREFGIAFVCHDMAALFAGPSFDAIDVATPRATHADWIMAGVRRGLPVLCQKPLTPTLAEAEGMYDGLPPGARVMVHENWRFRPWYREARAWLDGGAIGRVLLARASVLSSFMLPDETGASPAFTRQPFMAHEERLMIAEILIHHLDLMRNLCGELRVVGARTLRTRSEIAGETVADILLETREGAPVSIVGTMTAPGLPARPCERVELVGEAGTIVFDDWRLSLFGPEPRHLSFDAAEGYQESFDVLTAHFLSALRNGTRFETDVTDNIQTMRLMEHAYIASARPVAAITTLQEAAS